MSIILEFKVNNLVKKHKQGLKFHDVTLKKKFSKSRKTVN